MLWYMVEAALHSSAKRRNTSGESVFMDSKLMVIGDDAGEFYGVVSRNLTMSSPGQKEIHDVVSEFSD